MTPEARYFNQTALRGRPSSREGPTEVFLTPVGDVRGRCDCQPLGAHGRVEAWIVRDPLRHLPEALVLSDCDDLPHRCSTFWRDGKVL